jgi:zinc and cadmium transporter
VVGPLEWCVALSLSAVGSLVGLLIASTLLVFQQDVRTRVVPWLVSYAVGTLLGAAMLNLVPEALEQLATGPAFGTLLAGIITFFILEKLVLWRHCHEDEDCHVHRSTVPLVIIGDAVHTFVDGVVIAAATLTSVELGVTTAIAVVMHEIPQEAGDFAILLAAGTPRRRAMMLNVTSALGGILGAALMLAFGAHVPDMVPYVLAFAAGNFLYVAMADLIPSLHRGLIDSNAVRQVVLMLLGILTIALL